MLGFSLALAMLGLVAASVHARPGAPNAVVACFHKKAERFSAEAHPSRCNFRGVQSKAVEIPVTGMKWGHWGANPTRAAFGIDTRDGSRIRVIAHKPVICHEGRAWYSRIVILSLRDGTASSLRLPTCDRRP